MEWRAESHVKDELLIAYQNGEIASFLFGNKLDNLLHQIAREVSCFEQGKGAELRRLKDYLAESLPEDWESRRFERIVQTGPGD